MEVEGKPPVGRDGAKDLMRAFINVDSVMSKEYSKIIDNPVFGGCYPKIVDRVFYLERFAEELHRPQTHLQSPKSSNPAKKEQSRAPTYENQYQTYASNSFTTLEHGLICINITLGVGIIMTILVLGLFFMFLNNALYLKDEIS